MSTSTKTWNISTLDPKTGKVAINHQKLTEPLRWRKPHVVENHAMPDLFQETFTNEQIAAVFGVMASCPQHTFQVLTKCSNRMRAWFTWLDGEHPHWIGASPCDWHVHAVAQAAYEITQYEGKIGPLPKRWPLPNVWLGVSVENQEAANERIPDLLATPAALRFISAEPLLGKVLLDNGDTGWLTCSGPRGTDDDAGCCVSRAMHGECFHGIDWVIASCESGPDKRPCDVDWLRSLRDQCKAAEVPFFLKQATYAANEEGPRGVVTLGIGSKMKMGGIVGLPYLDSVQHVAMPEVRR